MSTIDEAAEIIGRYVHQDFAEDAARDLAAEGHLTPDPQIIRTVEEQQALDPDTVIITPENDPANVGVILAELEHFGWKPCLPAVVVATAAQVRAALEALGEA